MDKPRPDQARKKRIRRILYVVLAVVTVTGISYGLSRLEPAAPRVDSGTLYIDTVKRGPMVRQVRGLGRLVPEEVRWIPASTSGLVERVLAQPGVTVTPDTILVELSNPELEQSTRDAELQVLAAESDLANLRVRLESDLLNQQAAAASIEAEFNRARMQYEADSELSRDGLISTLNLNISRLQAEQSTRRHELERQRFEIAAQANAAQLASAELRLDQLRALHRLRQSQLERLNVRAGVNGVLQQIPVEVGQQLATGANIARISEPSRLKAELNIAETQARDIQVGQVVSIDTRSALVPGVVTRIDPAVLNGTVLVDVRLEGELPRGARPDLSVDGTIEIERLDDVLYVGRPAYGQADSTIGMFRVGDDGHAVQTRVRLGRTSVNSVEVVEGLNVGDRIILSDMSAWDAFDRVRLN